MSAFLPQKYTIEVEYAAHTVEVSHAHARMWAQRKRTANKNKDARSFARAGPAKV